MSAIRPLSRIAEKPPAVDWELLRRRVQAAGEMTEGAATLAKEQRDAILSERARRAAAMPVPAPSGAPLELVTFMLSAERYGIESRFVREVLPMTDYTVLPGAPVFVLGVINLRGEILAVVDLRRLFGLSEKGLAEFNTVVVVRKGAVQFGILADALTGMALAPGEALAPPVPTLTGLRAEVAQGLTAESIIVINGTRLLEGDWMASGGGSRRGASISSRLS